MSLCKTLFDTWLNYPYSVRNITCFISMGIYKPFPVVLKEMNVLIYEQSEYVGKASWPSVMQDAREDISKIWFTSAERSRTVVTKFKLRSQFVCLCWPWRAVGMLPDEKESHAPMINSLGIPKVIQSLWVQIGPVAHVWTPLTTTPCKPLTSWLWFPVFPCKSMKHVCFVSSR